MGRIIIFNSIIFCLLLISILFVGHLNSWDNKFYKHLFSIFIGIIFYLLVSSGYLKIEKIIKISPVLWFVYLIIIFFNLFIGTEVNGAKGWIYIGNFSFQPAELSKFSLVLFLPWIYQRVNNILIFFILSFLVFSISIVPIFLQPDLGFSILLFLTNLIFNYLLGVNGFFILFVLLCSFVGGFLLLKPYQLERLTTFLDPYRDPLGAGWQTIQSVNCIINGGIMGQGFGKGMISRLGFLPEKDTDFIFSVIVEDMGLIGSIFIIILYVLLLDQILWAYKNSNNEYQRVIVSFVFAIVFIQSFINIAMNTMSGPITGLPLPLISYGGTNMIVSLFLLSLVNRFLIENWFYDKIRKWF